MTLATLNFENESQKRTKEEGTHQRTNFTTSYTFLSSEEEAQFEDTVNSLAVRLFNIYRLDESRGNANTHATTITNTNLFA